MRMRRIAGRVLALVLLTVTLLPSLWATGSGEAPVKAAGPVTLQMSWWGGDARHKGTIAAIELLSWFLTDVESARAQGMIRGMYGTPKLREALKGTFNATDLKMAKLLDLVDAEGNSPAVDDPPARLTWEDVYSPERDKLVFGQMTLEEFFKSITKAADPVLVE